MGSLLYSHPINIRLHDIDAAGVLFFARAFYYAHDIYEILLQDNQINIATLLKTDFIIPIVHTEASFKAPVLLNESLDIDVYLSELQENEFSLEFQFLDQDKNLKMLVSTRHVCLDKQSRTRERLPEKIVKMLTKSSMS